MAPGRLSAQSHNLPKAGLLPGARSACGRKAGATKGACGASTSPRGGSGLRSSAPKGGSPTQRTPEAVQGILRSSKYTFLCLGGRYRRRGCGIKRGELSWCRWGISHLPAPCPSLCHKNTDSGPRGIFSSHGSCPHSAGVHTAGSLAWSSHLRPGLKGLDRWDGKAQGDVEDLRPILSWASACLPHPGPLLPGLLRPAGAQAGPGPFPGVSPLLLRWPRPPHFALLISSQNQCACPLLGHTALCHQ